MDDFITQRLGHTKNYNDVCIRKTIRAEAKRAGLDPTEVVHELMNRGYKIELISASKKPIKRALYTGGDDRQYLTLLSTHECVCE